MIPCLWLLPDLKSWKNLAKINHYFILVIVKTLAFRAFFISIFRAKISKHTFRVMYHMILILQMSREIYATDKEEG